MTYYTISEIAKHAGKSQQTVRKALRAVSIQTSKAAGAKGARISAKDANRMLARQWPGVKLLPFHRDLPHEVLSDN
jgi:hypothetical protein